VSFSENPYHVMTVVNRPDGTVFLHCDNCGGDSDRGSRAKEFTVESSVRDLRSWMDDHVRQSHNLLPSDVESWGVSW
jgi:hypothetical protein